MSDKQLTIADALSPILNVKAVERLRTLAESMIFHGAKQDRIDGQALNLLLDRHERNRAAYTILKAKK